METMPKRSKGSLGAADRFGESAIGVARSLCLDVQKLWKTDPAVSSPIVPWAVRHAAWVLNRYQPHRRAKGKTSFGSIRQEPYRGEVFNFSQPVLGRLLDTLALPKLQARWCRGIWLGKAVDSDAHLVGTSSGVIPVRTCKGLPDPSEEDDKETFEAMQWTPWYSGISAKPEEKQEEKREEPAKTEVRGDAAEPQGGGA